MTAQVVAQSDSSAQGTSAPIKWERYRDADHNISVLLPKMPTALVSSFGCSEVSTSSYYAFADGAVYSLTIYSKKQNPYPGCSKVVRFDRDLLLSHIAKLYSKDAASAEVIAAAEDGHKTDFRNDTLSTWLIPEMSKDRWVELTVNHRKGAKTAENEFVESLELNSDQGKRIGDGAGATIGDIDPAIAEAPVPDPAGSTVGDPLMIISKPKASYTKEARNSRTQGVVTLRVTLFKNGSVGNIQVVKGLGYGLTDQAIAAAKRIVFLPKRVNGVPVTVVKTIEYSFSVY